MTKKYINLLPPDEQKSLHFDRYAAELINFGFWFAVSLILLVVFLAVGQIFFLRQLDFLSEQIIMSNEELTSLERKSLKQQVIELNLDLDNYHALARRQKNWSKALAEFARIVPPDVAIDRLFLDPRVGQFEAAGHSASRQSVLKLRENLLASGIFHNVNFPLDNLEKDKNVNWKYGFDLNLTSKALE